MKYKEGKANCLMLLLPNQRRDEAVENSICASLSGFFQAISAPGGKVPPPFEERPVVFVGRYSCYVVKHVDELPLWIHS